MTCIKGTIDIATGLICDNYTPGCIIENGQKCTNAGLMNIGKLLLGIIVIIFLIWLIVKLMDYFKKNGKTKEENTNM